MKLHDQLMLSLEPHLTDEQWDTAYEKIRQVYGEHQGAVDPKEVLGHLKDVGIELTVSLTF